ncbi:hypothetical protein D3C86_1993420 [compost metagenome]
MADVQNLTDPCLRDRAPAFSGGYFPAKVVEVRATDGDVTIDFDLQLRNFLTIGDIDGVTADQLVLKHDDAFA